MICRLVLLLSKPERGQVLRSRVLLLGDAKMCDFSVEVCPTIPFGNTVYAGVMIILK
jgi:hypothetical protein